MKQRITKGGEVRDCRGEAFTVWQEVFTLSENLKRKTGKALEVDRPDGSKDLCEKKY